MSRVIRFPFDRSPVVKNFRSASRTRSSFRDECDINVIMRKYAKTGLIDHVASVGGQYGNFIDAPLYHDAMNLLLEADTMFASLPSAVRRRFDNDPAAFLAFTQDESNLDEMRDLGLLKKEVPSSMESPASGQAEEPDGGQPNDDSDA